jgi:hypothetical protein
MRSAFVLIMSSFVFVMLGCGPGGGNPELEGRDAVLTNADGEAMPGDLESVYAGVEECSGLSAPAPAVMFSPTIICPASGRRCCLASADPIPCGDDRSALCGTMGRYHESSQTIELPDECWDSAGHEMVHHLLRQAGRGDWREHTGGEWACS